MIENLDLNAAWKDLVEKHGSHIKKGLELVAEHEFKLCAQQLKTHRWDGNIVGWKNTLENALEPVLDDTNGGFISHFVAKDAMDYMIEANRKEQEED